MVVSFKDVGVTVNGLAFPVEKLTVSLEARMDPRRNIVGFSNWNQTGPLEVSIGLEGVLTTGWLSLLSSTGETSGFNVAIGGATFTGVHLEQSRVSAQAFENVQCNAALKSWSPPSGLISGSTILLSPQPIAHAAMSSFTSAAVEYPYSFDYSVQAERIPRFAAGQTYPEKVRLGRLEKELTLKGANLFSFVTYSGGSGSANFDLYNPTGFVYNISVSGNINQQSVSIDDIGTVSTSIKQFLR